MALRTPLTVSPHLYMGDSTGRPLDNGMVYFGQQDKDPEFYPINIFLDEELTIPIMQPVRTKGGFLSDKGDMVEIHAAEVTYSVKVCDSYGRKIMYKGEMFRNNVSDFLVDEIERATAAENLIATSVTTEKTRAIAAEGLNATNISNEATRATAAEVVLDGKYVALNTTIASIAGGKKAYTTYAAMEAAAALPVGDPLKLPVNSSVDVTNDTDTTKNGMYAYDGTAFTKSAYDPLTQAKTYTDTAKSSAISTAASDATTKANAAKSESIAHTDTLHNSTFTEKSTGVNIFDKSSVNVSKGLLNTGELYSNADFSTSDYIPIKSGSVYGTNSTLDMAFYDSAKVFISFVPASTSGSTSPANAAFVRYMMHSANTNSSMFYLLSEKPVSYTPYTKAFFVKDLPTDLDVLADLLAPKLDITPSVTVDNAEFLTRSSKQLFDKRKVVVGQQINWYDGAMTPLAGINASDYIAVEASTSYIQMGNSNPIAEYDINKNYITGHPQSETINTSATTAFVRFGVRDEVLDIQMFAKGTVKIPYERFDRYALDEGIYQKSEQRSKWFGKNWTVLGDSITENQVSYAYNLFNEKQVLNLVNDSIGGSAIAVRAAPWDTNALCLRYVNNTAPADLVMIAAGTNDVNGVPLGSFDVRDNTTLYGALRDLLGGLVAKYPLATICFVLPFHRYDSLSPKFGEVRKAIIECCVYYGIPYFDSTTKTPLRFYNTANSDAWSGDGLHPNPIGHEIITDLLGKWLETI